MIQELREKIKTFGVTGDDVFLVLCVILIALAAFGLGRLSVQKEERGLQIIYSEGYEGGQEAAVLGATEKNYVASISGSKYHLPYCSGAKRINEENKIWFASREEAEIAGYGPAANCPGL